MAYTSGNTTENPYTTSLPTSHDGAPPNSLSDDTSDENSSTSLIQFLQLISNPDLRVLTVAGTSALLAIIFISVVTLLLLCWSKKKKGVWNTLKERKQLASKPLPLTPNFSEHTYDSPQTPEGSARVIQAVSWKSLQKGSLISRNGCVCRWMGTMTNDKGNLSAVVISTINERIKRERLRWNDLYMQSVGLPKNQNILSIIGYVFHKDQLHVVHRYESRGNLQGFLLEMYGQDGSYETPMTMPSAFIAFATGIINGVEFLSSNGFAHPCLSARKVLLSFDGVCKLYDLCLMDVAAAKARRYVLNPSIRFLPPETIFETSYTKASDVWGVGIVLWQVFSFGKDPFEELEVRDFKFLLKKQLRLPQPSSCPNELFRLMCDTWAQKPDDRLLISDIKEKVKEILIKPQTVEFREEECDESMFQEVDEAITDQCSQTAKSIESETDSTNFVSNECYSEVVLPEEVVFTVDEVHMVTDL